MKTAIQQLIEKLEENRDMFKDNSRPITAAYQDSLNLAKGLLEEEKKQIILSHNKANENWEKGYPTPITEGEVYYNETFKQQTP